MIEFRKLIVYYNLFMRLQKFSEFIIIKADFSMSC